MVDRIPAMLCMFSESFEGPIFSRGYYGTFTWVIESFLVGISLLAFGYFRLNTWTFSVLHMSFLVLIHGDLALTHGYIETYTWAL